MSEPGRIRKSVEQIESQYRRIEKAINERMNRIPNAPFFDNNGDEEEYSMLQRRASRVADITDRMISRRNNRR